MQQILEVKKLKKYFPVTRGIRAKAVSWIKAVDGVTFSIPEGKTFALVGESGCGKTTTAKTILLLERPTAGSIFFNNNEVTTFKRDELQYFRSSVQAVFQDPFASLSPRLRVGSIIAEPLWANKKHMAKKEVESRVKEVLSQVGLDPLMATLFPHEFSGGQRQRIAIARSLILHPSLIILDEPVSALDVSMQAQIMNLLKDLQEQFELSYLLIAHNLGTVRYMSQWVGIMYLGMLVEQGPSEKVFLNHFHPYTNALLSAALPSHPDLIREEVVLSGEVPTALDPPSGCRFHPRCSERKAICNKVLPKLVEHSENHYVACHLY